MRILTILIACSLSMSTFVAAAEPLSELVDLKAEDLVIKELLGDGKSKLRTYNNGKLQCRIPASILQEIKKQTGKTVVAQPTLELSGFRANRVKPILTGLTGFKSDTTILKTVRIKSNSKFSIVKSDAVNKKDSSLNSCQILVETEEGNFKIFATWYVNRTGQDETQETIEGAINWIGPIAISRSAQKNTKAGNTKKGQQPDPPENHGASRP